MKTSLLLLLSVSLFSSLNQAMADLGDENPFFGQATYGGTGCVGGTLTQMPGAGSVAFQLDDYRMNLENGDGRRFDRKVCTIAVPLHVPSGMRIGLGVPRVSGFTDLSEGASLNLGLSAFLSGGDTVRETRAFAGPFSGDLMASEEQMKTVYTGCGKDGVLNVSVSAYMKNAQGSESAFAIIDTIELGNIKIEQCE